MAVYDPHRRKRIIWQPEFALPAAVVLAFPVVVSGIIAEISVPLAAIYLGVLGAVLWVARCRVTLTAGGIVEYGLFGRRRVPVEQIEDVTVASVGYSRGTGRVYPAILLTGGSQVILWSACGFLLAGRESAQRIRGFYFASDIGRPSVSG